METKSSIRKRILNLRNSIPLNECSNKSMAVMQNILSLSQIQTAEYILCYASYKSEVKTGKLMEEFIKRGKQIYLPRVSGEEMDFYHITSPMDLTEGYKGIPEPSIRCTDVFTKEIWNENKEHVVMLIPGAAFSETGARIGYGKGYYDRYLERIPCAERIALCYEMQIVEDIPVDEHDIPVSVIVTEEKIRHIINAGDCRHYYI